VVEVVGLAPRLVGFASGCSLLVDRELFDALGGFDEGYYPAYYEDPDLCRRIWAAGRAVAVTPASRVTHRESSSTSLLQRQILADWGAQRYRSIWDAVADPVPGELPRDLDAPAPVRRDPPPGPGLVAPVSVPSTLDVAAELAATRADVVALERELDHQRRLTAEVVRRWALEAATSADPSRPIPVLRDPTPSDPSRPVRYPWVPEPAKRILRPWLVRWRRAPARLRA
jgi:hypothetical protein